MSLTIKNLFAGCAEEVTRARKRFDNAKKHRTAIAYALKETRGVAKLVGEYEFNGFISSSSYDEDATLYLMANVHTENMKSVAVTTVLNAAENLGWDSQDSSDFATETRATRTFKYRTQVGRLKVVLEINAYIKADGEMCRIEQVGVEVEEKPIYAIKCA